jgi:hypothetical protein
LTDANIVTLWQCVKGKQEVYLVQVLAQIKGKYHVNDNVGKKGEGSYKMHKRRQGNECKSLFQLQVKSPGVVKCEMEKASEI